MTAPHRLEQDFPGEKEIPTSNYKFYYPTINKNQLN